MGVDQDYEQFLIIIDDVPEARHYASTNACIQKRTSSAD